MAGQIARGEIWLLQSTGWGVGAPLQRKQAMHAAVPCAVGIVLEPGFTKSAIWFFELWDNIRSTQAVGNLLCRASGRRATANHRLRMTDKALVSVKYRAHAG